MVFTTAYGFFLTRAQKQLSLDQYSTYATSSMTGATDQDARITVNRVEGSETSKTLYLTVEHVSGGGIELNTWTYDLSVPLVRESGEWKIDQLLLGTSPAPVLPLTK